MVREGKSSRISGRERVRVIEGTDKGAEFAVDSGDVDVGDGVTSVTSGVVC